MMKNQMMKMMLFMAFFFFSQIFSAIIPVKRSDLDYLPAAKASHHLYKRSDTEDEQDDYYYSSDNNDEDDELEDDFPLDYENEKQVASTQQKDSKKVMEKQREEMIQELMGIFGISRGKAQNYLIQHNWNLDRTLEAISEDTTKEETTNAPQDLDMCPICCSDFEEKPFDLGCHHFYCNDCHKTYLTNEITEGKTRLKCMDEKCKEAYDEEQIGKLTNSEMVEKYKNFLNNEFAEKQKNYERCRGLDCQGYLYKPESGDNENEEDVPAVASCQQCYYDHCFSCQKESHLPLSCKDAQHWEDILKEGDANQIWLKENTKPCPKCGLSIEKNDGCMHMRCRKCQHEFCWMCQEAWFGHNTRIHGKCGKELKDMPEGTRKGKFFIQCLNEHDFSKDSIQKEVNFYQNKILPFLQTVEEKKDDFQFLKAAHDEIIRGHKTMMWVSAAKNTLSTDLEQKAEKYPGLNMDEEYKLVEQLKQQDLQLMKLTQDLNGLLNSVLKNGNPEIEQVLKEKESILAKTKQVAIERKMVHSIYDHSNRFIHRSLNNKVNSGSSGSRNSGSSSSIENGSKPSSSRFKKLFKN